MHVPRRHDSSKEGVSLLAHRVLVSFADIPLLKVHVHKKEARLRFLFVHYSLLDNLLRFSRLHLLYKAVQRHERHVDLSVKKHLIAHGKPKPPILQLLSSTDKIPEHIVHFLDGFLTLAFRTKAMGVFFSLSL